MTKLSAWKMACAALLICAMTVIASPAQTFITLVNFDGKDGAEPFYLSLVQGTDGNLFGTTEIGGTSSRCSRSGCGTVFKVTLGGMLATLPFVLSNGAVPQSGLVLATDGSFYGTTEGGGINGQGTVFRVTPEGKLTVLYSFCALQNCADGIEPYGALIQATDGNFYGTTYAGGAFSRYAYGTVFRLTPGGVLTTLYSFCALSNCADGAGPTAGLVQGTDGNFYGTTADGGAVTCGNGYCGTVFKITPSGTLTTLHSFDGADGFEPAAGLALGLDGNFYGTTFLGGDLTCDPGYGCGTVFTITPSGTLTTLHSFEGPDGAGPGGTLALATDGNFYGTTSGVENSRAFSDGTVFDITTQGALSTIYSFSGTDGADPAGGLLQATDGNFYGTTAYGGDLTCNAPYGCGTVFALSTGLGPFVSFVHNPARTGGGFGILGQSLAGTTSVSLNGTPASFTVKSDTFMEATVPTGATTGYVTVTTGGGTLTSNLPFHVLP
jgi:uncharacterized repeat protein (TIGR03803 family)